MKRINPVMLQLALNLRQYSKARLRKEINFRIPPRRFLNICDGALIPTQEELQEISRVLHVRPSFFQGNPFVPCIIVSFHESNSF